MRTIGLALLALLAWAGAARVEGRPRPAAHPPTVDALVERDGDRWSVRYRFGREAPGWAFTRSAVIHDQGKPWRPLSWVISTPGLRWERRGDTDVIVAEDGSVPREVRIDFRPAPLTLQADYEPALVFTGGSVALFTDHFLAEPSDGPKDPKAQPVTTQLKFRDRRGKVLHRGVRYDSATFDGEGSTYVLFGPAEPLSTEHLTAVVDPALPSWFRDELLTFLPRVLAYHAETLGSPALPGKPMVMMSWGGAATGGFSQHGSVLPGLIVMQLQGSGMLKAEPALLASARWFIAHESAHFWLGQTVHYESPHEAWITEGGADLLAVRAVAQADAKYDSRAELQREVDSCVKLSAGRGIASAADRGEHRAYYACGAVFALIAEAASKKPFAAFIRPLIESNRPDGILSRAEWLAGLDAASGDATLGRDIARLLDKGAEEPTAAIASLFARAGVPHEISGTGRLLLK